MKEVIHNCYVCQLDEITNGENMDFTYKKDELLNL